MHVKNNHNYNYITLKNLFFFFVNYYMTIIKILYKYFILAYFLLILRIIYTISLPLFKSLIEYLPDFIESSGILLPKLTQWLLSQNNITNEDITTSLNRLLHSQEKDCEEYPPKIDGITYINNKPSSHGCIGAVYIAYFNDKQVCVKVVYPKLKSQLRYEIYLVKCLINFFCFFSHSLNDYIITINFFSWLDSLKHLNSSMIS